MYCRNGRCGKGTLGKGGGDRLEARLEAHHIPSLLDVEKQQKRAGLQRGSKQSWKEEGGWYTSQNRLARRAVEQPRKNEEYWGSQAATLGKGMKAGGPTLGKGMKAGGSTLGKGKHGLSLTLGKGKHGLSLPSKKGSMV